MLPKHDRLDSRQESTEGFALFVTLTRFESKNFTIARHIVAKVICETPVSVSMQAAGTIIVIPQDDIEIYHVCMVTGDVMNVYRGRSFYFTIAKFGKFDASIPKHQEAGGIAYTPEEIVHINNDRFLYHSCAKVTRRDSWATAVSNKPTQAVRNK